MMVTDVNVQLTPSVVAQDPIRLIIIWVKSTPLVITHDQIGDAIVFDYKHEYFVQTPDEKPHYYDNAEDAVNHVLLNTSYRIVPPENIQDWLDVIWSVNVQTTELPFSGAACFAVLQEDCPSLSVTGKIPKDCRLLTLSRFVRAKNDPLTRYVVSGLGIDVTGAYPANCIDNGIAFPDFDSAWLWCVRHDVLLLDPNTEQYWKKIFNYKDSLLPSAHYSYTRLVLHVFRVFGTH